MNKGKVLSLLFSTFIAMNAVAGDPPKADNSKASASSTSSTTQSTNTSQNTTAGKDDDVTEVDIPMNVICDQVQQQLDQKQTTTTTQTNNASCVNTGNSATAPIKPLTNAVADFESFQIKGAKLDLCSNVNKIGTVSDGAKAQAPVIEVTDQNNKRWRFKFYFGNSKTFYGKTTAHIQSSRADLTIKNLQPYERRSDGYFKNFFHESAGDMGRIVDEPTNIFKFALQKNKDEIFLNVFHPKFIFAEGDQEVNGHQYYNDNVQVSGTLDGKPLNGTMPLHAQYGEDFKQLPGNVGVVSWEDSHKLIQVEAGYGRQIALIKSQGKPILKYTPEISAGVYLGIENNAFAGKGGYIWDVDSHVDNSDGNSGMKVMGVSASISQRLELTNRKDNVGLFVENKFSYGKMNYAFLDGNVDHDITYGSVTVGFTVAITPRATIKGIGKMLKKKDPAPADTGE